MPLATQFLVTALLLASLSCTLLAGPLYGLGLCSMAWAFYAAAEPEEEV